MTPVFNIKDVKYHVLDSMKQALGEKDQDYKAYDPENTARTDQGVQKRLKGNGPLEYIPALVLISKAGEQFPAVSQNFPEGVFVREHITDNGNEQQCKRYRTYKQVKGYGRCMMKYIFLLNQRYDEPPEILILPYCFLL